MNRPFRKRVWKPPAEERDSSRSAERGDPRRVQSERDSQQLGKREFREDRDRDEARGSSLAARPSQATLGKKELAELRTQSTAG